MKPLMLIPPAQAEALFDAWNEQSEDRFSSLPWLDDDTADETIPLPAAARGISQEAESAQQGARKRAA